ncbi:MAG: transglycosylase family protein [Acidimicrobiales bacterium]|nr:transglycosylase family protein [Acidimicrobiales bacterium]
MLCALAVVASIATVTSPVSAATPLAEVNVAAFSSRAEAWTAAREEHRDESQERAVALAEEVRQAEIDRIAAEEAARQAELDRQRAAEEAARTTTTTQPPTTTQAPTTTAAPSTTAPADDGADGTTTTTTAAPGPGSPTAAQWEVLRQCESSGNYSIVSANGRYRGAYQFSQATWDWVAAMDRPDLVGVDPASATPADQDALALSLWTRQGWRPWPICGQQAAAA